MLGGDTSSADSAARRGPDLDHELLRRELGELLDGSPMACASVSRFERDGRLQVETTAGPTVFRPGAQMPIECSSNFAATAVGEVFASCDLTEQPGFDRSWDQVTLAVGWRSTCAVPLMVGTRAIGAVSFCAADVGLDMDGTIDATLEASDRLVLALLGHADEGDASSRVIVCADDRVTAEGLARIAERQLTAEVEISTSIEDAAQHVRAGTDLIITDSHVRGMRVDEQSDFLRRQGLAARVLVVSSFDTQANRLAAARAGAIGYVSRAAAGPEIGGAVLRAAMGEPLPGLPPRGQAATADPADERLTLREGQVLVLLERGLQVKQIARALGISDSTVKGYVRNVFTKLDVHSTTAAIYAARASGLLQSLELSLPPLGEPGL
ncbi:MAG TPA: response regulator transcription factor [Conexibacter sp.]|nr:response regulator transcription factor [Conexibacter sp.]